MHSASPPSPAAEPVLVWDLPVRLFHWLLVLLVIVSGVTGWFAVELGTQAMRWHMRSGYCILALVLFRIGWGFVGGAHARFASFVRGPRAVWRYCAQLLRSNHATHAGHNPLGGWSVVLMLAALATQTITGLFVSDEDLGVEGPLAHLVSNRVNDRCAAIHEVNFYVLVTLVALHLAAILFYWAVKRDNLVRPMFTGYKRLPSHMQAKQARGASMRAAVLLLLAAALVGWIVY